MRIPVRLLALVLMCGALVASGPVVADDSDEENAQGKRTSGRYAHHVAVGLGVVVETEGDEESDRYGLEYEYIWKNPQTPFTRKWGVGILIENDRPPISSILVTPLLVYHPVPQARLIIAPGYNIGRGEEVDDSWVLRLGMCWEFEVGERFAVGPALFYDILERGNRSAVLAVGLGYAF